MTNPDPLIRSLHTRFEDGSPPDGRQIVFWHDPTEEYADVVEGLGATLDDVKVIRVDSNEFAIKHRLLVLEPNQNFIVYRKGETPTGVANWLQDLEFAYGVFTADPASLIGEDLGLTDPQAQAVIDGHSSFFRAADRRERLRRRLSPDDNATLVRAKMCAVILKTKEHALSALTQHLLMESAEGESAGAAGLVDYGLTDFYWSGVADTYGYVSPSPNLDDFYLWMFRSAFDGFPVDGLGRNLSIDFSRWRDSKLSSEAMARLGNHAEHALGVSDTLDQMDWRDLLDSDVFQAIERKITRALAEGILDRSILTREVVETDRRRHFSFWYSEYETLYRALCAASELLTAVEAFDPSMASFDDGLSRYATTWSRIDQLYRHFRLAVQQTEDSEVLQSLIVQVENFYTNRYVSPLATAWQEFVDASDLWAAESIRAQRDFFRAYVKPLLDKGRRVVVIISDALRYEVAEELTTRLRRYKDDRSKVGFEAALDPTLGVLPSYTQLGMAALLPHTTLGFTGMKALTEVDGKKADGTVNRSKILEPFGGRAIQASDLSELTVLELRSLTQEQQFLYVYHNKIDATGDKRDSERRVFEAANETIDDLVKLTKKFASADVGAILITADHGFLFQDRELDESGYLSTEPQGDLIHDRDRRRVIGRGLKAGPAFRHFTPTQLGLSSDFEVLIPKGTKRLRLQGSGARYVHGGATLQEIVVPVISVSYTDSGKNSVRPVAVSIQQKSPSITTGVLAVDVHQSEPVTDKVQSRELRAGLYAGDVLISNETTLRFTSESMDPRERYVPVRLTLRADADSFNNREVELRLEEQIPNTTQWRVVERAVYTLKRAFQADF